MTTGASGTYAINGAPLVLLPTSGQWKNRDNLGYDGNAHPIYPAVRDFELQWNLMSTTELQQLHSAYLTSMTGTMSWDLPEYGANAYVFKTYSGTTLDEPEIGKYFMGWVEDVTLLIVSVRT